MGCIQSRHDVASPRYNHDAQFEVRQDDQVVTIATAESRNFETIRALKNESYTLCQQIKDELPHAGASMRTVYQNAAQLYRDLRSRAQYIEGDSPSHYQDRLNNIRHDFNAIQSIGSYSDRYFDRSASPVYYGSPSASESPGHSPASE